MFGVSAPTRVSSPRPPETTPLRLPPAAHIKVSAAAPPVRFSTRANDWPFSLPASVPSMTQVLGVSAPTSVSFPRPPSTTPLSLPSAVIAKVSEPSPPLRFSTPVKVSGVRDPAARVPAFEPVMAQRLVRPGPTSVSSPEPLTIPSTPPKMLLWSESTTAPETITSPSGARVIVRLPVSSDRSRTGGAESASSTGAAANSVEPSGIEPAGRRMRRPGASTSAMGAIGSS